MHSPRRVDRLVYLDAAVDHRQLYHTPGWLAAFPTEPPYPSYGDYGGNSIPAWQLWAERLSGPEYPEAELRSMFRLDTKGIVIGRAAADSIERVIQRGTLPAHFNQIRAPALAIYAVAENPQVMFPFWNSLSSAGQARARKNYTVISDAWRRQIERFRREVSHVRMREIPGGRHYVFLTHSGEVRHEMLDFLLADL